MQNLYGGVVETELAASPGQADKNKNEKRGITAKNGNKESAKICVFFGGNLWEKERHSKKPPTSQTDKTPPADVISLEALSKDKSKNFPPRVTS